MKRVKSDNQRATLILPHLAPASLPSPSSLSQSPQVHLTQRHFLYYFFFPFQIKLSFPVSLCGDRTSETLASATAVSQVSRKTEAQEGSSAHVTMTVQATLSSRSLWQRGAAGRRAGCTRGLQGQAPRSDLLGSSPSGLSSLGELFDLATHGLPYLRRVRW